MLLPLVKPIGFLMIHRQLDCDLYDFGYPGDKIIVGAVTVAVDPPHADGFSSEVVA